LQQRRAPGVAGRKAVVAFELLGDEREVLGADQRGHRDCLPLIRRRLLARRSCKDIAATRTGLGDLHLQRRNLPLRRTSTPPARPAPATCYRRFGLLRRFFRWLSRRNGVPDPFFELEAPPKPQQEADWLTEARLRTAARRGRGAASPS